MKVPCYFPCWEQKFQKMKVPTKESSRERKFYLWIPGNQSSQVQKFHKLCKYELRRQFFVNASGNLWNMLPDEVAFISSVSSFKRLLDGFWCDRDLYYNYKANMWYLRSQCSNSTG